ncbi:MAG: AbrB/MazE/SpoVT family DNA-binding domain-containing protein [Candidatus Nezhaarchaeales archaeon]
MIGTVDLTKSFYAKVGDDFRVTIPKPIREVEKIVEGDIVLLIVGTVIRSERRMKIPGEET